LFKFEGGLFWIFFLGFQVKAVGMRGLLKLIKEIEN
jgi:hypothetical protein